MGGGNGVRETRRRAIGKGARLRETGMEAAGKGEGVRLGGDNGDGGNGEGRQGGGKHMECLGGIRLQSFLTLFTLATPVPQLVPNIKLYQCEEQHNQKKRKQIHAAMNCIGKYQGKVENTHMLWICIALFLYV